MRTQTLPQIKRTLGNNWIGFSSKTLDGTSKGAIRSHTYRKLVCASILCHRKRDRGKTASAPALVHALLVSVIDVSTGAAVESFFDMPLFIIGRCDTTDFVHSYRDVIG